MIESWNYPSLLSEFFKIGVTFLKDSYSIPAPIQIAKRLEQNKNDYFIELKYERERYENPLIPRNLLGNGWHDVLKDFDTSVRQPPYRCVHVTATPKHLNLPQWVCYVALVNSRVEMRSFFAFAKFIEENWQERKRTGKIEWKTSSLRLKEKDKIEPFFREIVTEFVNIVEKDMLEKYGLTRT